MQGFLEQNILFQYIYNLVLFIIKKKANNFKAEGKFLVETGEEIELKEISKIPKNLYKINASEF